MNSFNWFGSVVKGGLMLTRVKDLMGMFYASVFLDSKGF